MDKIAAEAARLLFDDGGAGWIVAVLLGLTCLHLYRDGLRMFEARIAEAGTTAAALERASQTNAAVAAALESRTRVLEDLARLSGETARAVERGDERARERSEEMLRRLDALQHRPRP